MLNKKGISHEDFLFFKDKIFDLSGIHFSEKKQDLVSSRIQSFMLKNAIPSFFEFRSLIERSDGSSELIQDFINLLTTNKTNFFREPAHFDFLVANLIPRWLISGKRTIQAWSCAASTGEEPYSLAMVLDRHLNGLVRFNILATDIDTKVLKTARNGVYPNTKIAEIPEKYQQKYINHGKKNAEGFFKVTDHLHSCVQFKKHNLIERSNLNHERFDLIFCRNVLIYFEPNTIQKLTEKFHQALKPDGMLFIGHSESLQGHQSKFRSIQPSIFQKIEG